MSKDIAFVDKFSRGLGPDPTKRVARFLSTSLGQRLHENDEIQMFFRNNYLDFYWKGCRILNYTLGVKKDSFKVNRAYMEGGDSESKHRDASLTFCKDELWLGEQSFSNRVLKNLDEILSGFVKGNKNEKSKLGEKELLYAFWLDNKSKLILDVEVAYSARTGKKRHADRLDIAWVDVGSSKLRFVEAKRDTNTKDLRSSVPPPPVVDKMLTYRNFLEKKEPELRDSYRRIIENILELGIEQRFCRGYSKQQARNRLLQLEKTIQIDTNPLLMVFETGKWNQNDEDRWEQLKTELKKKRFPDPIRDKRQQC